MDARSKATGSRVVVGTSKEVVGKAGEAETGKMTSRTREA
jgi:hypothetical protein